MVDTSVALPKVRCDHKDPNMSNNIKILFYINILKLNLNKKIFINKLIFHVGSKVKNLSKTRPKLDQTQKPNWQPDP